MRNSQINAIGPLIATKITSRYPITMKKKAMGSKNMTVFPETFCATLPDSIDYVIGKVKKMAAETTPTEVF